MATNAADQSIGLSDTMECPICAERISSRAKKCRHCGETLDPAMRKAEEALRASERSSGNVYMNAAVAAQPAYQLPPKSRMVAVLLAFFLGGFGAHKFYLNRPGQGLIYLIFFWTFIPAFIAFFEAIVYALSNDQAFHLKYG